MTPYIVFYITSILFSFFFLKKKSGLVIFFTVFSFFMVGNFLIHTISIRSGKEGYSIFTKKILPDEQIYYLEAKELYTSLRENENVLSFSQKDKDILGKNYYSVLLFFVFWIFSSTEILLVRAVTSLFSAFLFVQVHRFIRESGHKKGLRPMVFLLLLYPTLLIRGLQIEQEMLVNFLVVLIINNAILKNKRPKPIHYLSLLLVKIIGFVSLVLARLSKILRVNFNFVLQFFLLPILIIYAIRFVSPDTFNYVVAVKSYVVMDGRTDFISVDYSNVLGITSTTLVSWYYYLFAPLDLTTVLNGSAPFKILLIEPLFLVSALLFLFLYRKHLKSVPNLKWIFYFIFYYSLIYILGESHITSLMRRRIVLYIFVFLLVCYVFNQIKVTSRKSKNFVVEQS